MGLPAVGSILAARQPADCFSSMPLNPGPGTQHESSCRFPFSSCCRITLLSLENNKMSPWAISSMWGGWGMGEWGGVSRAHSLQSSVSTFCPQVQPLSLGWQSPHKTKPKPV